MIPYEDDNNILVATALILLIVAIGAFIWIGTSDPAYSCDRNEIWDNTQNTCLGPNDIEEDIYNQLPETGKMNADRLTSRVRIDTRTLWHVHEDMDSIACWVESEGLGGNPWCERVE